MDIYTTCFTLPRNAPATTILELSSPTSGRQRSSTSGHGSQPSVSGSSVKLDDVVEVHEPSSAMGSDLASAAAASTDTSLTSASERSAGGSTAATTPVAASDGSRRQRRSIDMKETMNQLCVDAMSANQCLVACEPIEGRAADTSPRIAAPQRQRQGASSSRSDLSLSPVGKRFNFHVSGGYQQVMSARGSLLRDNPFKRKAVVKVPRSEVLDGKENVNAEMRRKLDEIASLTKAHLAIVGQVAGNIGFGLETERNVEIVITGAYESLEQARVRLLVLLDELSSLHSEVCEIDYKLHNIISGRKRCVIQNIQEETATNIYFPTPLSGVLGQRDPALLSKQNFISITGEFFGVQRARDMLFQVSIHKSKCIISRDTAILPRKLDWMLNDRLEEIKNIMNDNGTFINFPPIGSQASLISVYGDHRVNIERTIRAIMQLACQFHVASFWLLPASFDVFMPPPTINAAQIPSILRHISVNSGAEAVFKSNCFEFHGLESEVRAAVQLVLELDFVKQFHHEIRFQIELANEHRDFISGKKNGKLNKIMKSADVKIKFETFNDYNFLIDVAGNDTGALLGLSMLQEELPAEISFHVPEAYHKRIIGVGGKNIQRIMKEYGVYVKFFNAEEALGGYTTNEDNVIARTPAKNAAALDHLKQNIVQLVNPKDRDFVTETVSVPRRYHRTLLGEKSIFIHDIEAKTNCQVRFPNKESASDMVSIFGPESQVHIAAQLLLDHVPFEAEYRLPYSTEMAELALSPDFAALTDRIKRDLNITILPWVDRTGADEEDEETIIKFCLNRSNTDFLPTARDLVEEHLVRREIKLHPGSLRPRSDSFADSFPFFNSKLLSTVASDAERSDLGKDRSNLRMAASSHDIKALFDAKPAHEYRMPPMSPSSQHQQYKQFQAQQQQQHQQQHHHHLAPFASQAPHAQHFNANFYGITPIPPTSPYLPHQQMPLPVPLPHQSEYHWPPAPPRHLQAYPAVSPVFQSPQTPTFTLPPSPQPAAATSQPRQSKNARRSLDDVYSNTNANSPHTRGASDEMSAFASAASPDPPPAASSHTHVTETKMKEIARQPRSFAGRTQSLDLSSHPVSRHMPSASVDQVNLVFSHLGLK